MACRSNDDDELKATVEDVLEPTNVSGGPQVSQTFPSNPSNSLNPLSGFGGMAQAGAPDPSVKPTVEEIADIEKFAKFLAQTSDSKEIAEVMKDFQKAHPGLKPQTFMTYFPMKMNPLIANLPPQEKFPKLMLMLDAFAQVDPVLGKTMESLGPLISSNLNQPGAATPEDFFGQNASTEAEAGSHDQFDPIPDLLASGGPFNEGLDDFSLEELNQMGIGEFGNMSFDELMKMAQSIGNPGQPSQSSSQTEQSKK